ncbi:MAG: multiheme c-type cytochrome [Candidatus Geothermincolia bacterium]
MASGYVGAAGCATCHREIFQQWSQTGHARILHRPGAIEARDIPLPVGLTTADISYIVGGFRWKAIFLDRQGYLVTSNGSGPGANQFNLQGRHWVDFRPGEKVPYDCGRCHTTGYSAEGHQNGLPGIVGTWRLDGVQCESCHGPGARHARSSLRGDIITRPDGCASCHRQESTEGIPLVGNFLAPYTEANQLEKSKMQSLGCTGCHDPHRSGEGSQRRTCATCHPGVAQVYRESLMAKARVGCIDCHMPPVGRLAEARPDSLHGDLRSHLFVIRHHTEFPKQTAGGANFNPGFLTVDHVCMPCHDHYENRQWAEAYASVVHRLQATTNVKVMRLQAVISYVGLVFALLALFSAASAKGWIRPFAQVQTLISVHRHAAWASFAVFVFMVLPCIFIHTPLDNLGKLSNLGWFLLHPINGLIGLALYTGKILVVRFLKVGWSIAGTRLGLGLFLFWLVQIATVIIVELGIMKI